MVARYSAFIPEMPQVAVLDLLEKYCQKSTPVLHWFSGTNQDARRAVALGYWFSVGPAMLRGKKGRAILQELPMEKILPETDGPFAKNGSAPFMPWEAINIVDTLEPLWEVTKEEILNS